jgi:hypothetical protein
MKRLAAAALLFTLLATSGGVAAPGTAVRFYGTGAGDTDRIKLRVDDPPNSADVGAGDFTIEFWMKAAPADNESGTCDDWICGNIIFDRDIFASQARDYGISMRSGLIYFGTGGSTEHVLRGDQVVADGAWHHIAVTRVRSTGEKCLLVDGAMDVPCEAGTDEDISYPDGYLGVWPNDPFLVVGAEKHDVNNQEYPSFNGTLDEIRVWTVARSPSEIALNRNVSLMGTEAGLVVYWRLDDGTGMTATDSSGDGSHGDVRTGQPGAAEWLASTAPIDGGGGGPDADGDGCSDSQEQGLNPAQGGLRDPNSVWDFFDVPTGSFLLRDRAVAGADIAAIVQRFGSNDTAPGDFDRNSDPLSTPNATVAPSGARANYHPAFDRGGTPPGADPWDLLAANGAVSGGDISAAVLQFGHSCL